MEKPSLEINLPDTHEEGKLYVVDSLNNLNKLNVCPDGSQHAPDEEENTGGTGESTGGSNIRNQCLFFVTFILTLIVSLALVSFVIFLITLLVLISLCKRREMPVPADNEDDTNYLQESCFPFDVFSDFSGN